MLRFYEAYCICSGIKWPWAWPGAPGRDTARLCAQNARFVRAPSGQTEAVEWESARGLYGRLDFFSYIGRQGGVIPTRVWTMGRCSHSRDHVTMLRSAPVHHETILIQISPASAPGTHTWFYQGFTPYLHATREKLRIYTELQVDKKNIICIFK